MNTLDIKKIRKSLKLTQTELAEKLGVHYKTIQNWEKGGVIPESKKILLRNLGLIRTDVDGTDDYDEHTLAHDKMVTYISPAAHLTCLLPFTARATEISPAHIREHSPNYERIASPVKGADFATVLSDDGLGPEFPDGAVVFFKHIDPDLFIEWGKVHAISTKNGLIIKRLNPGTEPDTLLCSGADPLFIPFEIPRNSPGMHFYKAIACTSIK